MVRMHKMSTSAGQTAGHDATAYKARVIAVCCLATFLDGFDLQALGLAVPMMAETFGSAAASFTFAVTATLVGMAIGSAFLAPLGDRFGRRPLMIASVFIVGATSIGLTFATTPFEVGLWRGFTGLGLGTSVPVATAITVEHASARYRTAIVSAMIAFIPVGGFVASLTAPLVSDLWGWKAIFWVGGVLPLILSGLFFLTLPESLRFLVVRNPGNLELVRRLERLEGKAALAPATPGQAPAKTSVLALLQPRYRMRTLLLWAMWSMNLFVNLSIISWLPSVLRSAGWAHDDAIHATGLASAGGVVGSLLLSWLVDRGKLIPALGAGYVTAFAALVLLTILPAEKSIWMPLLVLVGVGTFGAQITFAGLAASFYPVQIRTTGVGWGTAVGRTGSIAGPIVIASVMASGAGVTAVLAVLMAPLAICAAGVLLIPIALGDDRARLGID